MLALPRIIRIVAAVAGIGSIHFAFIEARPDVGFAGLLVLAAGNFLGSLLAGGSGRERWLWAGVALAGVVLLVNGGSAEMNGAYALFLVPVLFNILLFLVFAGSLLPGRVPVVTRLSRLHRTRIDPVIERYTRRVTGLWAAFFAAVLGGAAVAFSNGSVELASWILNVASPAGALVLFLIEHLYRYLRPGVFGPTSLIKTLRLMARPDAWRPSRRDA